MYTGEYFQFYICPMMCMCVCVCVMKTLEGFLTSVQLLCLSCTLPLRRGQMISLSSDRSFSITRLARIWRKTPAPITAAEVQARARKNVHGSTRILNCC